MRDLFLPLAILVVMVPAIAILVQQYAMLHSLRGTPDYWPATIATVIAASLVGLAMTWSVVMLGYSQQWDLAAHHLGLQ